ncbi:MAG: pyridoxamine kinase [Bacilli bacterium]|nr:pyridoxamine kinase [Bacilli bacterium]
MKPIRILSVQDISCFGQCSLTVALPILSALGIETAILPTAILSTHTAGFKGFTFRDLKEDVPAIASHWEKEGIFFDAIYTGYLGNGEDVRNVIDLAKARNKGPLFVDPAFGDNGKLYGGFDQSYVECMKELCFQSDYLLPNLTEAAFLLDRPYEENVGKEEAEEIIQTLRAKGAKTVALKGVRFEDGKIGIAVSEGEGISYYSHSRIPTDFHGTGDVFASVFVAGLLRGLNALETGRLAADFVRGCIENTLGEEDHRYGVCFEPLLHDLEETLRKALGR